MQYVPKYVRTFCTMNIILQIDLSYWTYLGPITRLNSQEFNRNFIAFIVIALSNFFYSNLFWRSRIEVFMHFHVGI